MNPQKKPDDKFDSIIIGAGISGLVAAYRLKKPGRRVLLIESSDRAGGVIQSAEVEGFLLEQGPNSLRGTHELLDLVDELQLNDELVAGNPRAPAYVYAGGALHVVPMSPQALIKTKLISSSAKRRLLREPFIERRVETGEESIANFVRRRLGDETLERMVAPFLSGVYAGDPEKLSVQACFPKLAEFERDSGSILRGALNAARAARKQSDKRKRSLRPYRLCSFRRGLKTLTQKLACELGESLMTSAEVVKIEKSTDFEITINCREEARVVTAASLIIASPAFVAARLLESVAHEISALLGQIPYVSIASVPIAYRSEQLTRSLDGFGFLAPRGEGLRTLGSIWNSSLFADRAPEGWVCLTNFIGGATDPEAANLSDEELIRIVHRDLSKVLQISAEPRRLPITRYERAIPQYNLGHAGLVAKVEAKLHNLPGLWLAGNYLHGVSLGDCIKQALKITGEVELYGSRNYSNFHTGATASSRAYQGENCGAGSE